MSEATSSGSASASAITAISVGPASKSMPTRPNSCRFASATYALPAPMIMSTGVDVLQAERKRGESVGATDADDRVGPADRHRVEHRRSDPVPVDRGRRADDPLDAGRPRHDGCHQRRGDQRIATTRRIGPDRADRHVPVTEHDPRQRLDLDVLQRGALRLGESLGSARPRGRCAPRRSSGTSATRRSMSSRRITNRSGAQWSNRSE